jgi:DUF971 family protein
MVTTPLWRGTEPGLSSVPAPGLFGARVSAAATSLMNIAHPTELHLHEAEQRLDVTWSDGANTSYALAYLRGWCPCAHCQGHFVLEKRFVRRVDRRLTGVEPIGTYAFKPTWGDGHSSGIYAFEYLRRIATEPPGIGPSNESLLAGADPDATEPESPAP